MALENIVEKLFADNPDLSKNEAIKRLKEMKDPETGKYRWKAHTIRCRVGTYFKKKEKGDHAEHIESPVETMGPGSDLKIEGDKEEALDEIETDIKLNESDVSFLKVLILIFSIIDTIWVMFLIMAIVSVQFYPFFLISICLVVTTGILCYTIKMFIEKKEKKIIFKKAKWIVSYWFDSKGNFDNSFFKYNYQSGIEKEAVEYASKLIKKNIKEQELDKYPLGD